MTTEAKHTQGAVLAAIEIWENMEIAYADGKDLGCKRMVEIIDRLTAAPDLLEACREARRVIALPKDYAAEIEPWAEKLLLNLDAAISKATN